MKRLLCFFKKTNSLWSPGNLILISLKEAQRVFQRLEISLPLFQNRNGSHHYNNFAMIKVA